MNIFIRDRKVSLKNRLPDSTVFPAHFTVPKTLRITFQEQYDTYIVLLINISSCRSRLGGLSFRKKVWQFPLECKENNGQYFEGKCNYKDYKAINIKLFPFTIRSTGRKGCFKKNFESILKYFAQIFILIKDFFKYNLQCSKYTMGRKIESLIHFNRQNFPKEKLKQSFCVFFNLFQGKKGGLGNHHHIGNVRHFQTNIKF